MKTVTIIWECNCHESTPILVDRARLAAGLASSVPCRTQASVWLAFEPYDSGRNDHDFRKMGTRIIGPVADEQAESVIQQLAASFISAGFRVVREDTADD